MRIGVVGTNFISDMFMTAAKPFEDIRVTAVTSGHREHADAFAAKYDIPQVYDTLADLLKQADCDLVYLGVPNSLHAPLAKQCIEAGMPVFVEKPFASNCREAEEVIKLAAEKNVYVHDGIVPLYTDNFAAMKDALQMCGRIRRAVFSFGKYSSRYTAYLNGENPTTFRRELSNGSLMDLGVYCLSDIIGLFGKPETVYAHAVKLDTGVDGAAEAVLGYDGFDAVIMTSKISNSAVTSEIEGELGTLVIEQASLISRVWFCDLRTKEKTLITTDTDNAFGFQLQDILDDFAAERKESLKVPHALTLDIMQVLDECRKSAGIVYPADEKGE
ncbi:MAG: Gfo/Idh/MocA family oxidoreductase [Solobacterium sp.]|jgi:predicted dehydrogenase|nr:Gfo/Idh/MocA family oxidoreductase [Solobacterium sp.]